MWLRVLRAVERRAWAPLLLLALFFLAGWWQMAPDQWALYQGARWSLAHLYDDEPSPFTTTSEERDLWLEQKFALEKDLEVRRDTALRELQGVNLVFGLPGLAFAASGVWAVLRLHVNASFRMPAALVIAGFAIIAGGWQLASSARADHREWSETVAKLVKWEPNPYETSRETQRLYHDDLYRAKKELDGAFSRIMEVMRVAGPVGGAIAASGIYLGLRRFRASDQSARRWAAR
jgi:hypothetical protein